MTVYLSTSYSITCNINTQNVTRWGFFWLGCDSHETPLDTNRTDSNTNINCKEVRLAIKCVLDYCEITRRNISASLLHNQCNESWEGIMCDWCKHNYSLSVGTLRCLPSSPAYMVFIFVGVWIASGIATACSLSHSLQFYHQWGYNQWPFLLRSHDPQKC